MDNCFYLFCVLFFELSIVNQYFRVNCSYFRFVSSGDIYVNNMCFNQIELLYSLF